MRFIDEYVFVFRYVTIEEFVQFADRLKISMWHSKITKDVWPRSGIISIKQMRRRDYERAAVQLLRDQGCHVRFAKPHNVREKYAAILFKNFARAKHGLFLILKAFEPV